MSDPTLRLSMASPLILKDVKEKLRYTPIISISEAKSNHKVKSGFNTGIKYQFCFVRNKYCNLSAKNEKKRKKVTCDVTRQCPVGQAYDENLLPAYSHNMVTVCADHAYSERYRLRSVFEAVQFYLQSNCSQTTLDILARDAV